MYSPFYRIPVHIGLLGCRRWLRLRKRENENSYGTVIVSAVSIAICFEDQENILYSVVCFPSLPFICCQVLVS